MVECALTFKSSDYHAKGHEISFLFGGPKQSLQVQYTTKSFGRRREEIKLKPDFSALTWATPLATGPATDAILS